MQDLDKAIEDFSESIKRQPSEGSAYTIRGEVRRRKGEIGPAIADFDRAIALDPTDSSAWFDRGIAYSDNDDPDHAIADYSQAIRLKSDDAWFYNNRGNSYIAKNDGERALADYDRAIELNPKFALAYYNRGTAYRNRNDRERALADLDESIGSIPIMRRPSAIAHGSTATRATPIAHSTISPKRSGSIRRAIGTMTGAATCISTSATTSWRLRTTMRRSSPIPIMRRRSMDDA
jgi:tetratricopeptide (TPR) repeat protein